MTRIISELSEFSFSAKSFILQAYDVLARHRGPLRKLSSRAICGRFARPTRH
jgi:hypothetical protein